MSEDSQKAWTPKAGEYATQWAQVWFGIIDGRRFQIRGTHGPEAAEKYRYHTAERNYFMMWGKLPHHVIEDNCEVCDQQQARQVASWVDAHHRRFFDEIHEVSEPYVRKFAALLERNKLRMANMPDYKAADAEREKVIQFAAEMAAKVRNEELAKSANLGSDAKEEKHESGQQGEQATERAAEAKPENVEGQDLNQAAQ